ncbi:MAG TPA: hypothetical protein VGK06_10095 [Methanosarcina sp.]|jgi:hypothetical protein
MGADKIRCEVRAFDDDLDEWETMIECNKQREKTRIQKANEINKLAKIKAERARRKMRDAGIYGVNGGRPKSEEKKPFRRIRLRVFQVKKPFPLSITMNLHPRPHSKI